MKVLHSYRSHTCGELRGTHIGKEVKLIGWINQIRDHGGLIFIELRDHYGLTQCVVDTKNPLFGIIKEVKIESVVTIIGYVTNRPKIALNFDISTGHIEVKINNFRIESEPESLPIIVNSNQIYPEETRLKYRFLDLRREKMHKNIVIRSRVITLLRRMMIRRGFTEFQTPILTSSSPEGSRDYLVPSRVSPGLFYALPQSPQIFKQILMVAGFDRYFQIAPCFRDEDSRSDRLSGEFYQLDLEMSFIKKEDIFSLIEPIIYKVCKEFAKDFRVNSYPFPKISYDEAMLKYGTDKPDLRNSLSIRDVSEIFNGSNPFIHQRSVPVGSVLKLIQAGKVEEFKEIFFDKIKKLSIDYGAIDSGYILFFKDGTWLCSSNLCLKESKVLSLKKISGVNDGDVIFLINGSPGVSEKVSGLILKKLGQELDLIDNTSLNFCWITDFPMFKLDEKEKKITFAHNPFSMPQGGMNVLLSQDPLLIKSHQYDMVCNGIELLSGSIRSHLPKVVCKAFEIVGYPVETVEKKFCGLLQALRCGAPPHGGCALGIDRLIMLLTNEKNLRDIVAFPLNSQGQDLMTMAPSSVTEDQLKDISFFHTKPLTSK